MAHMMRELQTQQKSGQSSSLWNVSMQAGWSPMEIKLLKVGVMKYGVGKWTEFYQSQVIPTKDIGSCYLQLQRIMGQQSLAEFMGLKVDIDAVYEMNKKRTGKRKNGCLVNEGDKLTQEIKRELIKLNQDKYGLPQAYIDQLKLPNSNKVKVYDMAKIINSKKAIGIAERIDLLVKVKKNLEKKLKIL